jgi:hypothetical protein
MGMEGMKFSIKPAKGKFMKPKLFKTKAVKAGKKHKLKLIKDTYGRKGK